LCAVAANSRCAPVPFTERGTDDQKSACRRADGCRHCAPSVNSRLGGPDERTEQFTLEALCSTGITLLTFTINHANGNGRGTQNNPKGQANFAPAHVAGSNQVFHPTVFNLTFSFAFGGQTQMQTNMQAMNNPKTPNSCFIPPQTQNFADGSSFSITGTVLGWFS
jgi:hypothetical protein